MDNKTKKLEFTFSPIDEQEQIEFKIKDDGVHMKPVLEFLSSCTVPPEQRMILYNSKFMTTMCDALNERICGKWCYNEDLPLYLGEGFELAMVASIHEYCFVVKEGITPSTALDMLFTLHKHVNLNSTVAIVLYMLLSIRFFFGHRQFDSLLKHCGVRERFYISKNNVVNTLMISTLLKTVEKKCLEPFNYESQRNSLERVPVGSVCYFEGSLVYNYYQTNMSEFNGMDMNFCNQYEYVLYRGDGEFISWTLDTTSPFKNGLFQVQTYDAIVERLKNNGKEDFERGLSVRTITEELTNVENYKYSFGSESKFKKIPVDNVYEPVGLMMYQHYCIEKRLQR